MGNSYTISTEKGKNEGEAERAIYGFFIFNYFPHSPLTKYR